MAIWVKGGTESAGDTSTDAMRSSLLVSVVSSLQAVPSASRSTLSHPVTPLQLTLSQTREGGPSQNPAPETSCSV